MHTGGLGLYAKSAQLAGEEWVGSLAKNAQIIDGVTPPHASARRRRVHERGDCAAKAWIVLHRPDSTRRHPTLTSRMPFANSPSSGKRSLEEHRATNEDGSGSASDLQTDISRLAIPPPSAASVARARVDASEVVSSPISKASEETDELCVICSVAQLTELERDGRVGQPPNSSRNLQPTYLASEFPNFFRGHSFSTLPTKRGSRLTVPSGISETLLVSEIPKLFWFSSGDTHFRPSLLREGQD